MANRSCAGNFGANQALRNGQAQRRQEQVSDPASDLDEVRAGSMDIFRGMLNGDVKMKNVGKAGYFISQAVLKPIEMQTADDRLFA